MDNYWTRAATRRSSRRGLLQGTAAGGLALAAAGLIGCGDDDDDGAATPKPSAAASVAAGSPSAAANQPKRGGVLKAPQTTNYNDVFDPHTSLSQAGQFYSLIGNTAMRPSIDATKLQPELVEKWEVPGDGTEVVLTLRQGVTWHNKPPTNGRAFVADDLAFSITRISGKLNPDRVAAFQRASTLPNFDTATAVDEKTVRVKLTKPHSGFLYGLADWRNTIIPRDFVEKGGKFEDPTALVGTGPWTTETFTNGVKGTYKANPNYWEKGKPYLDGLEWVFYADTLSSQTGFAKGDVDYITGGSSVANESIKKLAKNIREESWIFGNWEHVRFNTTRKPFDDARVRLAFQRVFDYKNWADSWYGAGKWDWTGPLSAAFSVEAIPSAEIEKMPGYNQATKAADIKAANDMLSAAGFPNGKGISYKWFTYQPTGVMYENTIRGIDNLKKAFPEISVEMEISPDITVFSRRQVAGDFDVLAYTLFPAPDAVIEMTNNEHSKGSRNYGKFKDDTVDQMIEKAASQLDSKERAATLKDLQKLIIEKHMATIHWSMPRQVTYFQEKVKGMEKYGISIGGGSYDTLVNLRNASFA